MRAKNLTFRLYPAQVEQIRRAADASEQSISDYCRGILISRAASDLGERPAIELAPQRGRHNTPLERIARMEGITSEELQERLLVLYAKTNGAAPKAGRGRK